MNLNINLEIVLSQQPPGVLYHGFIRLIGIIQKQQKLMIDNFFEDSYHSYDKVYDHPETGKSIFLGDMQSALDHDFLRNQNIKTVITAAKDMDHIILNQSIQHIVYPLIDSKQENITHFFESFYSLIQQNIANGNILVHCAAGISRSSTLVISFIMKKQKKSFKQAIAAVRKARPNVLPNLGFERQLKQYEQQLINSSKRLNISSRNNVKTSESSKRPYILKTQFYPSGQDPNKSQLNIRAIPVNLKKIEEKYNHKDLQILKIYSGNYYCQALKNYKLRIRSRKIPSLHPEKQTQHQFIRRSSLSESMNRCKKDNRLRIKTHASEAEPSSKVFQRLRINRLMHQPQQKSHQKAHEQNKL